MRTAEQIQADANRLSQQLSRLRYDFLRKERDIVAKFDALEAEIVEVRKAEAQLTPQALAERVADMEARLAEMANKETKS